MDTMPWLRLYTELIDDPKLRDLTGDQFRDWIYLLCLARKSPNPGTIEMSIDDTAWRLRRPPEALRESLKLFAERGMVEMVEDGIVVLHFVERQHDKPSDMPEATRDRKRRSRARHADAASESRPCHADVTPMSRPCHALDRDTDRDTEVPPPQTPPPTPGGGMVEAEVEASSGAPADPLAPVVQFLCKQFLPTASPYQVDRLCAWHEQQGMEPDVLVWAMEEALLSNQRSLRYVEGILRRLYEKGIKTRVAAEFEKQQWQEEREKEAGRSGDPNPLPSYNEPYKPPPDPDVTPEQEAASRAEIANIRSMLQRGLRQEAS